MTTHPSFRRFYLVFVRTSADEPAQLVLQTRSGSAAIAAAEPVGGWVEGDDHCMIWPHSEFEGAGWRWAQLRKASER